MTSLLKIAGLLGLLAPVAGCRTADTNRIELISIEQDGTRPEHFETFDDAWYRLRSDGRVDVLLKKVTPHSANAATTITQILLLRCFWTPRPGRTYAEESMINARVSYFIFKNQSAVSYEGGAFVDYVHDDKKDVLRGSVEGALLHPLREIGDSAMPFESVMLSGGFRALRDQRRVVRSMNDVERLLGPVPPRAQSPPGQGY